VRRQGGSLRVEAPSGARLRGLPAVDVAGPCRVVLRIGRDVDLGRNCTLDLRGDGTIELGDEVRFGRGVRLQPRGGAIRIGAQTDIRDGVVLKSYGELVLGRRAILSHGCVVHCAEQVVLDDLVGFAEHATIVDSDHVPDGSDTYHQDARLETEPVRLERNVIAGAHVVILRGARVGANASIAAGAVVGRGDWPPGHLLGGVPARVIKPLSAVPSGGAGARLPRR
jgi:acetyltransferase-like isoleucine patch superfamily enzyme